GRLIIERLNDRSDFLEAQAALQLEARMAELSKGKLSYPQTGPLHWTTDSFDEAMAESAAVWRRAGITLNGMIQARGIPYLHGLQPNQYFPGTRTLTEWEKDNAYNGDPESEFYRPLSEGYAYFTNEIPALKNAGVPIVNLTDYLGDPPITIYSDNFSHFNHDGNRLLAEAVVKAVSDILP
ncbi:MAG: hypothetical protein KDL31_06450, partial [Kiritimatiellae bacterium]|nr:hypothetical protein [Kiritimatiellia bacterium]